MAFIYGFTEEDMDGKPVNKGLIKIGYTKKSNTTERIKEICGTAGLNGKVVFLMDAFGYRDTDFHAHLEKRGIERPYPNREFFKITFEELQNEYLDFAGLASTPRGERDGYKIFKPRIFSQDKAIAKAVTYFEDTPGIANFLIGAKVRFGKTPTAYWIANRLNAKKILILTYKVTDTKDEWSSYLHDGKECHIDFADIKFFHYSEYNNYTCYDDRKVLYLSYQGINTNRNILENEEFDLVIIDEDHYGAKTKESRDLLTEIKSKRFLHLSGTPYYQVTKEFGEDDSFLFGYCEEQDLKAYPNPEIAKQYADLPRYHVHNITQEALFKIGFKEDIPTLFGLNYDKTVFIYESEVRSIVKTLLGLENHGHPLCGIILNKGKTDKGIWKMPSQDACGLLKTLIDEIAIKNGIEISVLMAAGGSNETMELNDIKEALEKNCPIVMLTVYRMTTGVSLKELNYVFMLYGNRANQSRLESWMQTIGRAGTPYREGNKDNVYVYDFVDGRSFDLVYEDATYRTKRIDGRERTEQDVFDKYSLFNISETGIDAVDYQAFQKELLNGFKEADVENRMVKLLFGIETEIPDFGSNEATVIENNNETEQAESSGNAHTTSKEEKAKKEPKDNNKRKYVKRLKDMVTVFDLYLTDRSTDEDSPFSVDGILSALRDNEFAPCLKSYYELSASKQNIRPFEEFAQFTIKLLKENIKFAEFYIRLCYLCRTKPIPSILKWNNIPESLVYAMYEKANLSDNKKMLIVNATNGKFVKVAVELGVSPKNITAVCFTPFAFAYTNSVANGHWNSKSKNILLMTENDFLTELDKKSN
jgi:hypothetical protein